MLQDTAIERFGDARVARLATVGVTGLPHIVPITFAIADGAIYTAIDSKRKTTRNLMRLNNIAANGRASVLVDHYDEDWESLWWVRELTVMRRQSR